MTDYFKFKNLSSYGFLSFTYKFEQSDVGDLSTTIQNSATRTTCLHLSTAVRKVNCAVHWIVIEMHSSETL